MPWEVGEKKRSFERKKGRSLKNTSLHIINDNKIQYKEYLYIDKKRLKKKYNILKI